MRELARFATPPSQRCWYVAPSYRQAKQILWEPFKFKLHSLNWVAKVNEQDLTIKLKNNSTISLRGADNRDSLRGVGLNFLVMDEFAMIDYRAWSEVLRPTLSDTSGDALFISTPCGTANWAFDLYNMPLDPANYDWQSWQFTSLDGGRIPQDEIDAARRDLDERTFRQEYLATFESYAGRIYYGYDRLLNESKFDGNYNTIHCGVDFNINPMSAVVAVQHENKLHVIDEIRIFGSNTEELCDEIKLRYPKKRVIVYPDPAGAQRKTSAGGKTDHSILENAGFEVKVRRSHTAVRDRNNAVNSALCSGDDTRKLLIRGTCKYTIEGLLKHSYKEGSSQPDKEAVYSHMMDALAYLVDYLYPVKREVIIQPPERWGHNIS